MELYTDHSLVVSSILDTEGVTHSRTNNGGLMVTSVRVGVGDAAEVASYSQLGDMVYVYSAKNWRDGGEESYVYHSLNATDAAYWIIDTFLKG